MQTLSSIQTANRQYDTGERPVLIMCSDMHNYVCKYAGGGDTMKLYCEYIAASFLKIWKLPVPDFAFVAINYDHVKQLDILPLMKICNLPSFNCESVIRFQEIILQSFNPARPRL
jgi:hypothetical protein